MKSAILPAAIFCGVAVLAGAGLRNVDSAETTVAVAEAPSLPMREHRENVIYASGATAVITKEADGHYWTTAYVNSMPVRFLVDTGATAVVLNASDARSIGVNPDDLPRRARVTTANGKADAGVVTLGSVRVGGLEAEDIDAVVMDDTLEHSLLGMSFLNRFEHWEATRDSIVIRR